MALDPEIFEALIDTVRRFVAERLRPFEGAVEEADAIPADLIAEMRAMGLFGLSIAEEYGGLGLTMIEEARSRSSSAAPARPFAPPSAPMSGSAARAW